MANTMLGNVEGLSWINKRRAIASPGGNQNVADVRSYGDITGLRNYLQTFNAAYYTNALLDRLTVNDMIYAVRIHQDGGTTNAGVI